jgi:phosphoribosyl 1,2-cyclic phosphate phosphodiesterase
MRYLRFTILGCSSSGGVPRIGDNWGKCDPDEPKNRRRRCSLLVRLGAQGREDMQTRALIDTTPDLREQLISTRVDRLDGVLYTHEHADHIHGIDDLRAAYFNSRKQIPVYADNRTANVLINRFGYCFKTPPGSSYPSTLVMNRIKAGRDVVIKGEGGEIAAVPFELDHGHFSSLGFRIGRLAYTPDLPGVPEAPIKY